MCSIDRYFGTFQHFNWYIFCIFLTCQLLDSILTLFLNLLMPYNNSMECRECVHIAWGGASSYSVFWRKRMFSTFWSLRYPFCWTICVFCFLLFGLGKPFIHKIVWRQKKCFCHICILLFLIRIISEIYLRYILYLPGKVKIQILFLIDSCHHCIYPFSFCFFAL